MKWLKYALFNCLALFAGCQPAGGSAPSKDMPAVSKSPNKPAASAPAADVKLQILDFAGIQRLVASHQGQVVVMDCWSTGCPPCMRDFPQLVALRRKNSGRRSPVFRSASISRGLASPKIAGRKYWRSSRSKTRRSTTCWPAMTPTALYKKMKITSIPVVLVYDRRGKLRATLTEPENENGTPLYKQVGAEVQKLLAEQR